MSSVVGRPGVWVGVTLLVQAGCSAGDGSMHVTDAALTDTGTGAQTGSDSDGDSDTSTGRGPERAPKLVGRNADNCLLDAQGVVSCWGSSFGSTPRTLIEGPVSDVAIFPRSVASTEATSLACVLAEGIVSCVDAEGAVVEPGIEDAIGISSGAAHACAVTSSGGVACWGANEEGQLGDGTVTSRDVASLVVDLDDAVEVACGEFGTCARRAGGEVACWGTDDRGALGDGAAVHSECNASPCALAPAAVLFDHAADQVAAGLLGGCVRARGRVHCWGWNGAGEVGDGTQIDRAIPTLVVDLEQAVSIYAGYLRKCAIRAGGSVACWGWFDEGTLSGIERLSPVDVAGLPPSVDVSGGWYHLCALAADGRVWCWGDNTWGQLGDGTFVSRDMPAPVG